VDENFSEVFETNPSINQSTVKIINKAHQHRRPIERKAYYEAI